MDTPDTQGTSPLDVPATVPAGPAVTVGPAPVIHTPADYLAATPHAFDSGGGGFGGIIGGIISGIASLFGGGNSAEISAVNDRLTRLGNFVLTAVGALANQSNSLSATDSVGGSLWGRIFTGIFGPIVGLLSGLIHGASSDIGNLIGPLTKGLGNLRDAVRHIYDAWLRPILHAIDVTRQVLRVLAALHIQLAAAADAALGRLEGKLTAPLLLATKKINELSNQVNRIVTLDGALQRITLLKGLSAHATCVQRQLAQAPLASSTTPIGPVQPAAAAQTQDEMLSDLAAFVDGGGGPMADAYAAWTSTT